MEGPNCRYPYGGTTTGINLQCLIDVSTGAGFDRINDETISKFVF